MEAAMRSHCPLHIRPSRVFHTFKVLVTYKAQDTLSIIHPLLHIRSVSSLQYITTIRKHNRKQLPAQIARHTHLKSFFIAPIMPIKTFFIPSCTIMIFSYQPLKPFVSATAASAETSSVNLKSTPHISPDATPQNLPHHGYPPQTEEVGT